MPRDIGDVSTIGEVTADYLVRIVDNPNSDYPVEKLIPGAELTPAAGGVPVADAGGYYTGTDVEAVLAELPNKFTPITATVDGARIDGVLYIAHRGGPLVNPENTIEAYRTITAQGVLAVEQDCFLLLDGTLGIMHDSTLDRTTTSTGNTADHTYASWSNLVVDVGATLGGAWAATTQKPPTLDAVVREFGNKTVLVPESKNGLACAEAIVATLQRYGVRPDAAIVQSFGLNELAPATAAGYRTMMLGRSETPAALAAANVDMVCSDTNISEAEVAAYIAEGIEVGVYTIDRQYQRDLYISWGVTFFFSDDPVYLAGLVRRTSSPWAAQTWPQGHLSASSGDRGNWKGSGEWGIDDTSNTYRGALQGWACPIGGDPDASSFTITWEVNFSAISGIGRNASLWFSNTDKAFFDGASAGVNGYTCLLRDSGIIQIYKCPGGVCSSVGVSTGETLLANTWYQVSLTVTPTTITMTNVTTGNTLTVVDATYRGGYFQLAHARTSATKFRNVAIT